MTRAFGQIISLAFSLSENAERTLHIAFSLSENALWLRLIARAFAARHSDGGMAQRRFQRLSRGRPVSVVAQPWHWESRALSSLRQNLRARIAHSSLVVCTARIRFDALESSQAWHF